MTSTEHRRHRPSSDQDRPGFRLSLALTLVMDIAQGGKLSHYPADRALLALGADGQGSGGALRSCVGVRPQPTQMGAPDIVSA